MDIRIFTDLKDPGCVLMDLSSLIHAYEYAKKENNSEMTQAFLSLFHQDQEMVKIEKDSNIYVYLKKCPQIKCDEITWQMIKESYLIARLQNNRTMLRDLGKILSHWEQYVIEKEELDGLASEVAILSDDARKFILKYHDCHVYEEQKRKQVPEQKKEKVVDLNRSIVELIDYNKIYKKEVS